MRISPNFQTRKFNTSESDVEMHLQQQKHREHHSQSSRTNF